MENWKEIHQDFTEELQTEWESKGLSKEECKKWINVGLGVSEADYARWLRSQGCSAEWVLNYGNVEDLKVEYQQIQRERERERVFKSEAIEVINVQEQSDEKHSHIGLVSIRSGGQTGAERAALDAALRYNCNKESKKFPLIHITGWCPKGRLAEDGTIPPQYPLNETPSSSYAERAEWNIRDADAVLVLLLSSTTPPDYGTGFIIEKTNEFHKPVKIVFLDEDILKNTNMVLHWINENKINSLNVTGPRESNCPGTYRESYVFMNVLIREMKNNQKFTNLIENQKQIIQTTSLREKEKATENLITRTKRNLLISSQTDQKKDEEVKLDEELKEIRSEPMEIDEINQQAQILQPTNSFQRKITRGSFKSYLRKNARKNWFINNKLKLSISKDNHSKNLITLPDKSKWLYNIDIIDDSQINKWSQQVYQAIDNHWCPRCQRVGYYDGESYSDYCIDHICEEESCQNEAKQSEQGKSLCVDHFKQQENKPQEQFNAQIVQPNKGGCYD